MTNATQSPLAGLPPVTPDVELRLIADIGQLPIARAVAEDFALRCGSDIDGLADAKIAVDEVCNCLLSNARQDSPLICRFSGTWERIVLCGQVRCVRPEFEVPSTFGWQVLHSVADEVLTWVEARSPLQDERWLHIEVSTAR